VIVLEHASSSAVAAAGLTCDALPATVRERAKALILDLLGSMLAGTALPVSLIVRDTATAVWTGVAATIWAGGRAGLPGAVLANAVAANAFDLDDGYRPVKGHPGACVIPAAFAAAESRRASGADLLAAVVAGYEVALRAGRVLHAQYEETHCSGTWGALGAATAIARLDALDAATLDRVLSVAEYHAPIGPLMRDIDDPAMAKDGIGAGALAGVLAYELGRRGFDGPPHLLHPQARLSTAALEERAALPPLAEGYLCLDVYFKPHACCRWAQPAVEAVLALRSDIVAAEIEAIDVYSFHEATRLAVCAPRTTEEAQYSVPWPVASALLTGRVGPAEVDGEALRDERVRALAARVRLHEDGDLDALFPAQALARVEVALRDGRRLVSGVIEARGEPHTPLNPGELRAKFDALAEPVLGRARAARVAELVERLETLDHLDPLLDALGRS
jgi:2-methylcitrate dehydratase PrpD